MLRFRANHPLEWQPGQHLLLFVGDSPGIPYSIASAPDAERAGEFELAVSREASAEMLESLRRGGPLSVSPPAGSFVWRPSPRGSLFIGMGTGIAPLRAMLQAARQRASGEPCALLVGARNEDELLFRVEFESWAHAAPEGFAFEPTLSAPSEAWGGRRGRVQEHLAAVAASRRQYSAYLCGNSEMVGECTHALTQRFGFEPSQILSEAH